MESLKEKISSVEQKLVWGEFKGSVPLQVEVIREIQELVAGSLPMPEVDRLTMELAKALGTDFPRAAGLLGLDTMDLRRALRFTPFPVVRKGEERIYPTEGWIGKYLAYSQESESPLGWQFWSAVAVLAAVARRNFYWCRGRYELYLNHYILVVGYTGITKSGALNTAYDLVVELNRMLTPEFLSKMRGRIVTIGSEIYLAPHKITPERFLRKLSTHPSRDRTALLIHDEMVVLLGRTVKGSERMVHLLTDAYGCPDEFGDELETRADRIVKEPAITCLFGSTEEWMRVGVTPDMFAGGFMARVIVAHRTQKRKLMPDAAVLDPVMRHVLARDLAPWAEMEQTVELRRSEQATEWYEGWYMAQDHPKHPALKGYYSRKADHLHKLAGILQLAEAIGSGPRSIKHGVLPVRKEKFLEALEILENEEARLPVVFAEIGSTPDARDAEAVFRVITDWVKRRDGELMPWEVFARRARYVAGTSMRLDYLFKTLAEEGRVAEVKEGRKRMILLRPGCED